eukprot:TRINITY_DN42590_c0_g1_i1.p1 TRINITY_DN42590_c0_g1~~TRINITY_DN42590_c0_g1_i1.p1  ORF type:complete len:358 (+),score=94.32 TRINITY_DN42590_c0_g1_i1:44-1117(+)
MHIDENRPIKSVRWIIALWYACSVVGNMTSKMVLNRFEYPVTVMMGPTLCGALSVPILAKVLPIKWASWTLTGTTTETNAYKWSFPALLRTAMERYRLCLCLGLLSLTAGLLHRVALLSVAVSFAHTVKAIQPLYTCIFSYLVFASVPSFVSALSLLFVILGIMLSVFSEGNISTTAHGVLALQMSVACLSGSSVIQKVILVGLDRAEVFAIITGTASLLNMAVWFAHDFPLFYTALTEGHPIIKSGTVLELIFLVFVNSIALALQHFTSLSALQKLSPTSHSMVACMKRVVIIAASSLFFRNKMGPINILGATIAVAAVTAYEHSRRGTKVSNVASPKAAQIIGFLSPPKNRQEMV